MHTLRIITGSALAVVLSVISILCAYKFGRHLGGSGDEGLLYGALGGAADAFKSILPIAISAALASRQRSRAVISAVLFMVFSCYSFASEIGLYALARSSQTGGAEAVKARYGEFKSEQENMRRRLKVLGELRPSGTIKAELSGKRQSKLWGASTQCTGAMTGSQRSFCGEYEKLAGELATAEEAERLRLRDGELASKLSGIDLGTALSSADPQAEALGRFTGLNPGTVRDAMAFLIAALLELGSGFGLYAATGRAAPSLARKMPEDERSRPIEITAAHLPKMRPGKKGDPVAIFLKSCTATMPEAETPASELWTAYGAWAEQKGLDALSPVALGRRLSGFNIERIKRNGFSHYRGIALAPGSRLN